MSNIRTSAFAKVADVPDGKWESQCGGGPRPCWRDLRPVTVGTSGLAYDDPGHARQTGGNLMAHEWWQAPSRAVAVKCRDW